MNNCYKNKSYGFDLEKEEKLDQSYLLRGESLLREVIEGRMIGKRPRKRKQLGRLNDFLKGAYVELKRKAETGKMNIEAKNLPNSRTLTTTKPGLRH